MVLRVRSGGMAGLVVAALLGAGLLAAPAGAVFPGRNGKILVSTEKDTLASGRVFGTTWLASTQGRQLELRLPRAASVPFTPSLSPDGERIVYPISRGPISSRGGLAVSRVDGPRHARPLTRGDDHAPAWSPRGGAIAYLRLSGETGLHIVRARGGGHRRVYPDAGLGFAWSPNASRLAVIPATLGPYVSPFGSFIYVVDLHGDRGDGEYAYGVHVSWSRTGWLAYQRGGGLYVARPDGSQERLLASGFGRLNLEVAPYAWSADGRRIAFARRGRIFVVGVDGGEPRDLAKGYAPLTFSPDGRLLAFALGQLGSDLRLLAVKPVNGSRARVLRMRRSRDRSYLETIRESITGLDWQVRPRVR